MMMSTVAKATTISRLLYADVKPHQAGIACLVGLNISIGIACMVGLNISW